MAVAAAVGVGAPDESNRTSPEPLETAREDVLSATLPLVLQLPHYVTQNRDDDAAAYEDAVFGSSDDD